MQKLIIPFIRAADRDAPNKATGHGLPVEGSAPRTALVEHHPPKELEPLLKLQLPEDGEGKDGLLQVIQRVLQYSVNTWDQGFMDKLYASTNAVRRIIAAARSNGCTFDTNSSADARDLGRCSI